MKGGWRANAGRKPGTPNKDTAMLRAMVKTAITAQEQGIPEHIAKMSPLEVMANIMITSLYEGNKQLALSAASQLSPYIAPKLSHVTTSSTDEPARMTDRELAKLIETYLPKPQSDPEPITAEPLLVVKAA